jgi:hypothetical protein
LSSFVRSTSLKKRSPLFIFTTSNLFIISQSRIWMVYIITMNKRIIHWYMFLNYTIHWCNDFIQTH